MLLDTVRAGDATAAEVSVQADRGVVPGGETLGPAKVPVRRGVATDVHGRGRLRGLRDDPWTQVCLIFILYLWTFSSFGGWQVTGGVAKGAERVF